MAAASRHGTGACRAPRSQPDRQCAARPAGDRPGTCSQPSGCLPGAWQPPASVARRSALGLYLFDPTLRTAKRRRCEKVRLEKVRLLRLRSPARAMAAVLLPLSLAYRPRVAVDNPLLAVTSPSFEHVESAFFDDLGNASVLAWLAGSASRGEPRAYVLQAVLLRYCSVLLRDDDVRAMCGERHQNCTCDGLAVHALEAGRAAGDVEALAAQASAALSSSSAKLVRLQAAAAAGHDGAWPAEDPHTAPAELPAAVQPLEEGAACDEAAKLLLPLAVMVDSDAGPKAAQVPVSIRRLEMRWGGTDPRDLKREERLRAAEAGVVSAVRARGYYSLTADGVSADVGAARADFEVSARNGDAFATFNLG